MKNDIGLSRTEQTTPTIEVRPSTIWLGDNLNVMRAMPSEIVDLVYLDPPFNSKRLHKGLSNTESEKASFNDIWKMDYKSFDKADFAELSKNEPVLESIANCAGETYGESMKAYLIFMMLRIREIHRILKTTGSMWLHVDQTAAHYIKIALDSIFGKGNFRNEVVWAYSKWTNGASHFQKNHDTIFYYAKSENFTFNPQYVITAHKEKVLKKGWDSNKVKGVRQLIVYDRNKAAEEIAKDKYDKIVWRDGDEYEDGVLMSDWWADLKPLGSNAKERVGWPTQKPLKLLDRIIETSSNPGDLVFDPFCGCATTLVSANELGRRWIGCDMDKKASAALKKRIADDCPEDHGIDSLLFEIDAAPERVSIKTEAEVPKQKQPKRKSIANREEKKKYLFGEQMGICTGCKKSPGFEYFTIDHKIPRCKGGPDDIENLQLLCYPCNGLKGDGTMEDLWSKLKEKENAK